MTRSFTLSGGLATATVDNGAPVGGLAADLTPGPSDIFVPSTTAEMVADRMRQHAADKLIERVPTGYTDEERARNRERERDAGFVYLKENP